MSVAPYPISPQPSPRRRKNSAMTRRKKRYEREKPLSFRQDPPRMEKTPVQDLKQRSIKLPPLLQLMLRVQQASSLLALGLVVATLGVYAWTVYIPKLWSQEYDDLKTLQRHERNLTAANESIKHQLAKQAENPAMGLSDPHPAQAIFLPKTPIPPVSPPEKTTTQENRSPLDNTPVAY